MGRLNVARRLVPGRLKQCLRAQHRRCVFRRAMQRLFRVPTGQAVPEGVLEALIYGWGNASWSAGVEYLQELWLLLGSVGGPVLECGSGLSTLVLGVAGQRTGSRVFSLEHDRQWAGRVRRSLQRYRLGNCTIHRAELRSFGDYSWYSAPKERLPGEFALVVCDGPPGDTPGGRYGLLPQMRERLKAGCLILVDDFRRHQEQVIVSRWARELGGGYTVGGSEKPYARVVVPAAP
jgi:hypothetical protein